MRKKLLQSDQKLQSPKTTRNKLLSELKEESPNPRASPKSPPPPDEGPSLRCFLALAKVDEYVRNRDLTQALTRATARVSNFETLGKEDPISMDHLDSNQISDMIPSDYEVFSDETDISAPDELNSGDEAPPEDLGKRRVKKIRRVATARRIREQKMRIDSLLEKHAESQPMRIDATVELNGFVQKHAFDDGQLPDQLVSSGDEIEFEKLHKMAPENLNWFEKQREKLTHLADLYKKTQEEAAQVKFSPERIKEVQTILEDKDRIVQALQENLADTVERLRGAEKKNWIAQKTIDARNRMVARLKAAAVNPKAHGGAKLALSSDEEDLVGLEGAAEYEFMGGGGDGGGNVTQLQDENLRLKVRLQRMEKQMKTKGSENNNFTAAQNHHNGEDHDPAKAKRAAFLRRRRMEALERQLRHTLDMDSGVTLFSGSSKEQAKLVAEANQKMLDAIRDSKHSLEKAKMLQEEIDQLKSEIEQMRGSSGDREKSLSNDVKTLRTTVGTLRIEISSHQETIRSKTENEKKLDTEIQVLRSRILDMEKRRKDGDLGLWDTEVRAIHQGLAEISTIEFFHRSVPGHYPPVADDPAFADIFAFDVHFVNDLLRFLKSDHFDRMARHNYEQCARVQKEFDRLKLDYDMLSRKLEEQFTLHDQELASAKKISENSAGVSEGDIEKAKNILSEDKKWRKIRAEANFMKAVAAVKLQEVQKKLNAHRGSTVSKEMDKVFVQFLERVEKREKHRLEKWGKKKAEILAEREKMIMAMLKVVEGYVEQASRKHNSPPEPPSILGDIPPSTKPRSSLNSKNANKSLAALSSEQQAKNRFDTGVTPKAAENRKKSLANALANANAALALQTPTSKGGGGGGGSPPAQTPRRPPKLKLDEISSHSAGTRFPELPTARSADVAPLTRFSSRRTSRSSSPGALLGGPGSEDPEHNAKAMLDLVSNRPRSYDGWSEAGLVDVVTPRPPTTRPPPLQSPRGPARKIAGPAWLSDAASAVTSSMLTR